MMNFKSSDDRAKEFHPDGVRRFFKAFPLLNKLSTATIHGSGRRTFDCVSFDTKHFRDALRYLLNDKKTLSLDVTTTNSEGVSQRPFEDIVSFGQYQAQTDRSDVSIKYLIEDTKKELRHELAIERVRIIRPGRHFDIEVYLTVFTKLCEGLTITEIAKDLGVRRQRVGQIHIILKRFKSIQKFLNLLKESLMH